MSGSSSSGHHPAGRQARARLATYRRYAEIVTEQERALAAGDLSGYESLASAVHELQERIGLAPTPDLQEDPEAGHAAFVDEVADILRATLAANERIRTRLGGMHGAGANGAHHAGTDASRTLPYDLGASTVVGSGFDLRF